MTSNAPGEDPRLSETLAMRTTAGRVRLLLSGATTAPDFLPAGVLCWDDFLDADSRDALFAHICGDESSYEASRIYGSATSGDVDEKRRRSLVRRNDEWVRDRFLPALERPVRVARRQFGMNDVPFGRIELQVTASGDGDHFTAHCDDGYASSYDRMLTYVYYLHRDPRPFTGGTLNVFDSRKVDGKFVAATSFAKIDPRDNRLVIFPSDRFHEVAIMANPSAEFAARRITVNGWYRAQEGFLPPPPDAGEPADHD